MDLLDWPTSFQQSLTVFCRGRRERKEGLSTSINNWGDRVMSANSRILAEYRICVFVYLSCNLTISGLESDRDTDTDTDTRDAKRSF